MDEDSSRMHGSYDENELWYLKIGLQWLVVG